MYHVWEDPSVQHQNRLPARAGFHYYDSDMNGESCTAKKPFRDVSWNCIVNENNGFWGFPHFYYGSNPGFIACFIDRMREVRDGKLK